MEYDPTVEDYFTVYKTVDGKDVAFDMMTCSIEDEFMRGYRLQPVGRGKRGVMLVFDITNRSSFDDLKEFCSKLDTYTHEVIADTPMVVVGSKLDLADKRAVQIDEARTFAESLGCRYMEASAETKENLDEVFFEVYRASLSKNNEESDDESKKKDKKCLLM